LHLPGDLRLFCVEVKQIMSTDMGSIFIFFKRVCPVAIIFFLIVPFSCWAGYDYIDINTPYLRKIPMAVPLFKTMSGNKNEAKLSQSASELLSETLDFTGYFKMLERDTFLEDLQKTGIVASKINFNNWRGVGAELLITGSVLAAGDKVEMELRLYDSFKERLLVGKKYTTSDKGSPRKIIRRFCSEVIYSLTGSRGIFDSKIAFVSTGSGNKEIYICDFDGHNSRQETHNKEISFFPAWSSDGKWLAYTAYKKGKMGLYIKHLKGKQGVVVSKKGINISPAWVPGKFELAATFSFSGDQKIYLLTGRGKIIKRLTDKWGIDCSPSFSPDGKKMAFVSDRSGTPQIHIKDFNSGRVERLTFHGKYNTEPSWSPRGDKIAYSAIENGEINICVVGFDGRESIPLTRHAGYNESPSWSPDGSLIAFTSTRDGLYKIYVMTVYGTDQRRLLALPGNQTNPEWSPNVIH
jgi:TolB protein